MLELMLLSGESLPPPPGPTGQISFNTGGVHRWIVPEGVHRIHVAVLGPGQSGPTPASLTNVTGRAAGGSLVYQNDIVVTPGTELFAQVGIPGIRPNTPVGSMISSFLNLYAGPYQAFDVPAKAAARLGGSGVSMTRQGLWYYGGGSAQLLRNGHTGAEGFSSTAAWPGGWDKDLTIYTGVGTNKVMYGTGVVYNDNNAIAKAAGVGIVRILWGSNRAFPDLNITDMTDE